jgi:hypothetical protein
MLACAKFLIAFSLKRQEQRLQREALLVLGLTKRCAIGPCSRVKTLCAINPMQLIVTING